MSQSGYWNEFMRRRLSRRRLLQAGAMAGAGLWASSALGCGGGEQKPKAGTEADQPKSGGSISRRWANDPRGLDPHIETWPVTNGFVHLTNNALIMFNADSSKIVPDLAESWERPDDVTYTFKITKGVKWQNVPPVNGREFVAEDAKYSIERQMTDQPGKFNHAFFFLGHMAKIEAVDKYTIKFVTNEPYAPFMAYLANPWTVMVNREVVEKYGDAQLNAVGTGPFIMNNYTRNVEAVFVKNPDYFKKGKPYLDEVRLRFIPDASTTVATFLGEEVDIAEVDFTEVERVKKAKPNASYVELISTHPVILRTSPYDDKIPHKAPFNDKRVRQAIQLAIDKEEFIKIVRSGWGNPMVGMIPSNVKPWSLPESDQVKQNIPKAKQLLAEAGYPNGFKTEMICSTTLAETAQVAKDQLAKIGIDVEVKSLESAQYFNIAYKFDYQMSVHSMLGGEEPDEYLRPYFGDTATFFRWGNKEIQAKINEQAGIVDIDKRTKMVHEIQRMVIDDVPNVSLYIPRYTFAAHARVRNFDPAWNDYSQRMEDVWVSD